MRYIMLIMLLVVSQFSYALSDKEKLQQIANFFYTGDPMTSEDNGSFDVVVYNAENCVIGKSYQYGDNFYEKVYLNNVVFKNSQVKENLRGQFAVIFKGENVKEIHKEFVVQNPDATGPSDAYMNKVETRKTDEAVVSFGNQQVPSETVKGAMKALFELCPGSDQEMAF